MTSKRIQNRIAESRHTLPISIMIAIVIWYLAGLTTRPLYLSFATVIFSTFVMMEINNGNALIRIYSRMVSSSFLLMLSACVFLLPSLNVMVSTLSYVLFILFFFHTYQEKQSPGKVFHAFLFLGITSIFFVQILFFVPFLWILMTLNLMAMSHRNFWASVIGLITPYWFTIPYWLLTEDFNTIVNHFTQIIEFQPLVQYEELSVNQLATFAFVVLATLIGIIHFLRKSYMDKIRTRMLYTIFIVLTMLILIFMVLQTQHFDILLALLIVHVSPLIAHYLALTRTRITNISFIILIVAWIALTAYNLWSFSPIF